MIPSVPTDMDTLVLSDGRRLAFTQRGPADGTPVVYLHGLFGSPLSRPGDLDAQLRALGVRWLFPHRPGFGESDPAPDRTLTSFADDLAQLADALALSTLRLVGVSAGAPYAAACAQALGDRVQGVALVGAPAPPEILALRRHRVAAALPRHVVADLRLMTSPWGLELRRVGCDVALWHGTGDRVVPCRHASVLAGLLPRARTTLCPGDGHLMFRSRLREVLASATA